ncbi:23S rRNA (adenine(2503)-C(2))-methyltransferase RlmN [Candidatus Soleaferrea massiliensis]|uniref:23S rRNA (adenine(2503)-C(2))-methyltransferase RlmN n=1 Tax=Candidatus Soleaferrea massiliensis TaxID=1470354 RepID=UPI00058E70E7|nr:23S rRNA (adenine(2503)-C(2))-methyltransferase RlmN [Candidatus Soleaferrea massiliensis]
MKKTDIKSLTLGELSVLLGELGQPVFRARQIYKWLHQKMVCSFDEMSDLSLNLREQLKELFYINAVSIQRKLVSKLDGTTKYLMKLSDGQLIEAVLMRYKYGNSVCISTQAGCRMGCKFCASTLRGRERNLLPSEMLDEIMAVARDTGERVSHAVLMGIGEPLDNYDNVVRFLELLSSPDGMNMSLRHVSLSTCGLVDRIYDLMELNLGLTLSISLHAPNDEIRSRIMPVNRKWKVDELLDACRRYFDKTGRRISFEYTLIDGVNDSERCARELASKLRGMNCHVNLIPVNNVRETAFRKSSQLSIRQFQEVLTKQKINATIRRELGADINAACGQLRYEQAES